MFEKVSIILISIIWPIEMTRELLLRTQIFFANTRYYFIKLSQFVDFLNFFLKKDVNPLKEDKNKTFHDILLTEL